MGEDPLLKVCQNLLFNVSTKVQLKTMLPIFDLRGLIGWPNKDSDHFLELSSAVQNSELVERDCDIAEQLGQGRLAKTVMESVC